MNLRKRIAEARERYTIDVPERKKGARYHDDSKVINRLRNMKFEDMELKRLPKEEELGEWATENIPRALDDMAAADWHYADMDKWQ